MSKYYLLVIPVAIGIIAGAFLALGFSDEKTVDTSKPENLLTAKKLASNGSPSVGNPSAPITILEWGDYQCSFCFRFHETSLKTIQEEYIDTGRVNLIFKDFPLNGQDSILAAQAAYCADDQGKYWQYHHELYDNWAGERTGWITRDSLNDFAQTLEMELNQFNRCLDDEKYLQKVIDLERFGKEIGIDATPSFLVFNNEKIIKIRGNQPIDVFRQVIDGL